MESLARFTLWIVILSHLVHGGPQPSYSLLLNKHYTSAVDRSDPFPAMSVLERRKKRDVVHPVPCSSTVSAHSTCEPRPSPTEPCSGTPLPSGPGPAKHTAPGTFRSTHTSQTNRALVVKRTQARFKLPSAGSVHVRIRRDADEQMVLAHVTNRLHALVSMLTIQIFKDDWARHSLTSSTLPPSSLSLSEYVTAAAFPPAGSKPLEDSNPVTSTPAKPSSPPPEFSFNTPGKHIQPVVFQTAHQHRPFNAPLSYGMSSYSSMLHPGGGPATRLGFGVHGYRTLHAAPHRYGSGLPPSQTGQQRP